MVGSGPRYTTSSTSSHIARTSGNNREPAVFRRPQNSSNDCQNIKIMFDVEFQTSFSHSRINFSKNFGLKKVKKIYQIFISKK